MHILELSGMVSVMLRAAKWNEPNAWVQTWVQAQGRSTGARTAQCTQVQAEGHA